jgi:hypothetical protein
MFKFSKEILNPGLQKPGFFIYMNMRKNFINIVLVAIVAVAVKTPATG